MAVDRVKELVQEGLRRKLSGDPKGASAAWAEALRLDPTCARAREGLDELKAQGLMPSPYASKPTPALGLMLDAPKVPDAQPSGRKNPFARPDQLPFKPTPSPFTPLSLVVPAEAKPPEPAALASPTQSFGAFEPYPDPDPPASADSAIPMPGQTLVLFHPSPPPVYETAGHQSPPTLSFGEAQQRSDSPEVGALKAAVDLRPAEAKFDPFADMPLTPAEPAPAAFASLPFDTEPSSTLVFGLTGVPATGAAPAPVPNAFPSLPFDTEPSPATTMPFGLAEPPAAARDEGRPAGESQTLVFGTGAPSTPGPEAGPQTLVFGALRPQPVGAAAPAPPGHPSQTMVFGIPGIFPTPLVPDGPKTTPFGKAAPGEIPIAERELTTDLEEADRQAAQPDDDVEIQFLEPEPDREEEAVEVDMEDEPETAPVSFSPVAFSAPVAPAAPAANELDDLNFSYDGAAASIDRQPPAQVTPEPAASAAPGAPANPEDFGSLSDGGPPEASSGSPPAGFKLDYEESAPELATSTPPDGSRAIKTPPAAPVAPERVDVAALLARAADLIALDDYTGTMAAVEKVLGVEPDNAKARGLKTRCEATLLTMYESKLGDLERKPVVRLKPDEVVWLNLDHKAGFLLSLIDGQVSFEDIFALSSMSRLDTAKILLLLLQDKVIG